ncbi:MAG TPA: hypothetical protein DCW90_00170 [Lachnospiraceae bacterium]|mgnify:CR=1 FL=1|nr:hypothetical protein [Lachnospiraceae bacterium]
MAFADLLNRPLPSRVKKEEQSVLESVDGLVTESELDEILGNDDDPETPEDAGDNVLDIDHDDDDDEPVDDGDKEEVELSPEESDEAERILNLVATPVVIKDVLGDDAVKEFAESGDLEIAINEGLMTESGELGLEMDDDLFTESRFVPKTKVKFSLKDRLSQLFEISVLSCARAHRDPKYTKLVKIQKARRILKNDLRARYKSEAMKKAKGYLAKLKKSKSNVLSDIAKKFTKQ